MGKNKKVFENFVSFIKDNKLILVFAFITALGGILILGNVFSNFIYFKNHRYNISLSDGFNNFAVTMRAFLYNNIIQGSAESLAEIAKYINVYKATQNIDSLKNISNLLNWIVFVGSVIMFFVINIASYFMILLDIKRGDKNIVKIIRKSFLKTLLLELIKLICLTSVFVIIALVCILLRVNSTFYMIVSFSVATIVLYFIFYIYHFAIRNILLLNAPVKKAILLSLSTFKNNFLIILKEFVLLILNIGIFVLATLLLILPLMLLNLYFINLGYSIFGTINSIFFIIINIILSLFINLFIYKSLNDLYLGTINIKK